MKPPNRTLDPMRDFSLLLPCLSWPRARVGFRVPGLTRVAVDMRNGAARFCKRGNGHRYPGTAKFNSTREEAVVECSERKAIYSVDTQVLLQYPILYLPIS